MTTLWSNYCSLYDAMNIVSSKKTSKTRHKAIRFLNISIIVNFWNDKEAS